MGCTAARVINRFEVEGGDPPKEGVMMPKNWWPKWSRRLHFLLDQLDVGERVTVMYRIPDIDVEYRLMARCTHEAVVRDRGKENVINIYGVAAKPRRVKDGSFCPTGDKKFRIVYSRMKRLERLHPDGYGVHEYRLTLERAS